MRSAILGLVLLSWMAIASGISDTQLDLLTRNAPFLRLLYNRDTNSSTVCDQHIAEYIGRLLDFANAYNPGEQLGWAFKSKF